MRGRKVKGVNVRGKKDKKKVKIEAKKGNGGKLAGKGSAEVTTEPREGSGREKQIKAEYEGKNGKYPSKKGKI